MHSVKAGFNREFGFRGSEKFLAHKMPELVHLDGHIFLVVWGIWSIKDAIDTQTPSRVCIFLQTLQFNELACRSC